MATSFVLAVVLSFAAILVFTHALWLITDVRRRRLPPGPWPLPVIGSIHAVKWNLAAHRSLAHLAERYGPLMCIWFGRHPTVVVSTPDAARKVLTNPELAGRTFPDAARAEGHFANSVLLLPPGDKWRAMRRFATTELLTKARLDARQLLRQEKAQDMVRYVAERAVHGEPVDVGHAVFVTAINLVSRTLGSIDIGSRSEVRDMVRAACRLVGTLTVSDIFATLAAADIQGARRRFGAIVRYSHRIIDEQFMQRRRSRDSGEPRKNDMADVVIDKEKEWKEEGGQMNYDAVKGLFTDFLAAGTETVSSTVEWAMAELLKCPESMKMVTEELRTIVGTKSKREVEESDISQLPYLQAVVKETLRLHPAVPLAFQRAMATVEIEGYIVPKRANVVVNLWAVNRKSDVWTEPDKFKPERFIGKDISFWGKDFELIPFSAGRRMCLGLPLAYRMLHLILGSLLYHFDWTLPTDVKENGIDMTEKFGIVVSLATPLKAIAKKWDE
ncbi:Cytochrome P450 76C2 [Dichanthelium oligosanthes]|uniref:Cytochrome P450 76C2 n=1 Tax=Dichanthelium oligosanthes TaxID=888268 RepID=A0A1E5VF52_9POAL|nr:Cytochrome P450 76C2 [Dichanthelium oligosanthes]